MNIKELLGDKYRDDMTTDELVAELGKLNLVAKDKLPQSVTKDQFDKVASELSAIKKEKRELETKGMSAEQQLQKQLDDLELANSTLKKDLLRTTAKERLAKLGIADDSYIHALIEDGSLTSRETLTVLLDGFESTINSVRTETEKSVRSGVVKNTPKPPSGGGEMTAKEKFEKLTLSEKMTYAAENPEEYAAFSKE